MLSYGLFLLCLTLGPLMAGQDLVRTDLGPENVDIRGTVTDEGGEPILGVTVSVSGTTIGTATDMDGKLQKRLWNA